MGPLGAINSRQELARCNLSIAKYPVPWLFTFSFPSSLPVLRTFIPLLSPPRSRLIFFSSETSILRPSFAVGAPSGKKSDNNPVLRWGKEKKRDEFAEQFFDSGRGKKKLWNLDGTAPVLVSRARLFFCWLASDINVPSLFERNEKRMKRRKGGRNSCS